MSISSSASRPCSAIRPLRLLLTAVLLAGTLLGGSLLTGCDWTDPSKGDEKDPNAGDSLETRIVDVKVNPSPIPPGDTATFTVFIVDSTDADFEFRWFLSGTAPVVVTDSNQVQWPAPSFEGEFFHSVTADRLGTDLQPASREFSVQVGSPSQ